MARFRQKSTMVEAVQWDGTEKAAVQIAALIGAPLVGNGPNFNIQTPAGSQPVSLGDWVVKSSRGECRPCNPDVFTATYEPWVEMSWPSAPGRGSPYA